MDGRFMSCCRASWRHRCCVVPRPPTARLTNHVLSRLVEYSFERVMNTLVNILPIAGSGGLKGFSLFVVHNVDGNAKNSSGVPPCDLWARVALNIGR